MNEKLVREFNNILIPLDGSKESEKALSYGVSLGKQFNASLILVSVFYSRKPDSIFKQRIRETDIELAEDIEKMHTMYLMETYHEILKRAFKKQGLTVKSVLIDKKISKKSVVDVIQDVIEKEKIDLVIMSTYGRSGFKKLKIGSVAEELMKSLQIPFLCIKK